MTLPCNGPVGLAVGAGVADDALCEGDGHLVHVEVAESAGAGAAFVELDRLRLVSRVPSDVEREGGA